MGRRYETAWQLLRKLRRAMGQREDAHWLGGIVEMDDATFHGLGRR